MKKLFAAACCAVLFATATYAQQPTAHLTDTPVVPSQEIAPPTHPITLDQTREVFNIAGTQTMLRSLAHQALMAQRASAPEWIPASLWKELEDGLVKIDFPTLLYPTYAKHLSEEDANKAIAFYKTPEGQHFLQSTPILMAEAAKIGQEQGTRIAQQIFASHQQELLNAKTKYDTQRKREQDEMTNPAAPKSKEKPPVQPQ